jgi:sugar/nucleoside kinase (ribokinase family)
MSATIDYLLIGHMTADLVDDERHLGGTVSYAARVVKAFNLQVGILTATAHNEPLLTELTPYAEVKTSFGEATTTYENIYTPDGRTQFIRNLAVTLNSADIPPAWLSVPLVHIAPLNDEIAPEIIYQFPNAIKMVTLQGWLRQWDAMGRVSFKRWYDKDILSEVDIVVFSEEDIQEAPELEQEYAATVRHLIVTRGEKGGTYYHQGTAIPYEAIEVKPEHLTGAGDVFAASLLATLFATDQADKLTALPTAIQVAARLAAISVTRSGLESAPTVAEVQHALAAEKVLIER